jgi:toxin secretion/phage lysis holin
MAGEALSSSPVLLTALMLLMLLDYLTGSIGALVSGKVSSRVHTRGVAQKGLVWLLLVAIAVVEQALAEVNGVPRLPYLRMATLGFMTAEFISIVENVARAGAVPKSIMPLLARFLREIEP